MGSSISRHHASSSPSPPPTTANNHARRIFSTLLCGGSSSSSSRSQHPHMDDCPDVLLVNSSQVLRSEDAEDGHHLKDSFSLSCPRRRFPNLDTELETSSGSNSRLAFVGHSADGDRGVTERNNLGKCLFSSKELVPSSAGNMSLCHGESSWQQHGLTDSSSVEHGIMSSVPVDVMPNMEVSIDLDSSVKGASSTSLAVVQSTSSSTPDVSEIHANSIENQLHRSNSSFATHLGDGSHTGEITSGLGIIVSNRRQGQEDASFLQVDVVSISSNISSSNNDDTNSNQDARRNSRRLFWDAFSRRSSTRHGDSPTVHITSTGADDMGSRGGRWLLDYNGDIFDDANGYSGYLGNRIHSMNEQRRQSRSEILERLRGGGSSYEHDRRSTSCPSGQHPNGTCSCDPVMNEESTTRETITRIVMLAEALFEVLDEIHRQPLAFSISMVTVPAPDSVVDSFPLRNHEKHNQDSHGEIDQCYICLDEYEEGDKIRVLPCRHEYHMSCVDKWLKEIHGVCPLCRGDVCSAPACPLAS